MSKIELRRLSKRFIARREEIEALQNIEMDFDDGEFVSIVGPSGCGKSTIIRILNGIIKPSEGDITVNGYAYTDGYAVPREILRRMGFVFQLPNLYPWLTVRQNIYLPLKIFGLKEKSWMEYADYLLEKNGLAAYADKYPNSLSHGMSQRAGVVRAMVHKPDILMMDEPYGSLDERTRENLNLELLNIWKESGMTVVFITHNIAEAILLSGRIYIMASGPGRVVDEVNIRWEKRDSSIYHRTEYGNYYTHISNAIGMVNLAEAV
jgi:NitT/TauT family transport system ATP-binding protein